MSNGHSFTICVYCYNLYNCQKMSLSLPLYSFCVRHPPDDGRSGRPKHVAV